MQPHNAEDVPVVYSSILRMTLEWDGVYDEVRHLYRVQGAEACKNWLQSRLRKPPLYEDVVLLVERWVAEEGGWEPFFKAVFEEKEPSAEGTVLLVTAVAGVRTPIGGGSTPIGDAG